MNNLFQTLLVIVLFYVPSTGRDTIPSLELSGTVDVYYKYDISGIKNREGMGNIATSFAGNQNAVSIGMANLILSQSWNKVGFVADVAFGPRGQQQSLNNGADGNSFHIQNLNVSYNPAEWLTLTAGFMSTFIGYEIISPTGNFHYSTSYLFTNGPFQNGGVKATLALNDKVTLMAGLFNDWNVYQDKNGTTDFGAQLEWAPTVDYDLYFNLLTGAQSGILLDFVSTLSFTPEWMTGINFTSQKNAEAVSDYIGLALYQQYSLSETFDLGIRGEWFKYDDLSSDPGQFNGQRYLTATLSGNIHLGALTLIPEWRIDFSDVKQFTDGDGEPTMSACQIVLAAVYDF